jgi:protoporphyrinogen oxidase
MDVAILGGGLTGLTVGHLLNQKGIDFTLLEKESECGGLMRSLVEDGYTFDYGGSHILFSKDKEALGFLVERLGDNKVTNRRNTKILYKGRYVKYPFENGLADLSPEENFECLREFIQTLIKKEKGELAEPRNLNEWFYYMFGKGMADKYMIPYNEKIWKHATTDISLEWVERIPNPPVDDILKSSLGIPTEGYTHQLDFQYPEVGGIQTIIKALETGMEKHIQRRFQVKKILKNGRKWVVSDGEREIEFDKVICTIPIHYLIEALANGGTKIPPDVKNTVGRLKFNSIITIMLGIDVPKLNDLSWLYIPDKIPLTHRISFPSNFSPKAAPQGKSSVLAEVTCTYGDEVWNRKDDDLICQVVNDLHELKITDRESVCFTGLRRSKYAYVISDLDFEKNMKTVSYFSKKIGIDLVGRFAEFRYMNMDACVRRAMEYTAAIMP